jgi:hypothetical protein
MRTILVLPIPFDNWDTFVPFVRRFVDTFKQFPPGADYELYAMCQWGEPINEVRGLFYGTRTRFEPHYGRYSGSGSDIAAALTLAQVQDAFMVCFTARCYFHRPGWLARYVEAREKYGPGVYSASTSFEHRRHLCTRGYAADASLLREWQGGIKTKDDGPTFEVGPGSITDFALENKLPAMQVTFDGEQSILDSRAATLTNIFRRGDQSAMLVWDKHTDEYAAASNEGKMAFQETTDP